MKKKNEIMHNVVRIFFATLLSLSAAVPATAAQMPAKQSGGPSCDMDYITTDTGDFSQSSVKTCLTDNPGVISLSAGARFSVHFPDNPTTGMTWGLMRMPPSVMLISAEHTSRASCHTGMTGCRGEFTSTFKAIHHGTGNMVFTHSRLWENTYPSVKILRINVQ
ncbi:protease inhibitor I42 family protein [Enterobacter asburiae]|uniref:protease inhibitor I42 family protein n=1 Tax=Enterobacter asburiae TaxID=61645 RepID=UPI0021D2D98B|nr:protease inhibitor I42 family protein [Enterobacter asburiae]